MQVGKPLTKWKGSGAKRQRRGEESGGFVVEGGEVGGWGGQDPSKAAWNGEGQGRIGGLNEDGL